MFNVPGYYFIFFRQLLVFWKNLAAHAQALSVSKLKLQHCIYFVYSEAAIAAAAATAANSLRHRGSELP
jgi:hypothetical protein